VGGAQENTIASVLGLRARPDLDIMLVSGPTTGPEGSLEDLVRRVPGLFTLVPTLVRPIHPWLDCFALRDLSRLFALIQPDIVHTHSGKAGVLGRLAARRANVPTIVHTIHGPSFGAFQGALSNWIFRIAERWAGRYTTHFVAVAQAMIEQYLAEGIGCREQYSRILSGFDVSLYSHATNDLNTRAALGLLPGDFVVGKIARLFALKGHADLFAVAPSLIQRCPHMRFLLVGDGPWRQRFELECRGRGLHKHFVFTGLVAPEEMPRYVGVMDALVHLSRREGLARALPQAMAAGKPIIAYDCDGAREVCVDAETGFLLAPGDLTALTDRLLRLAGDPLLGRGLGGRGRALVMRAFPVERMIDEIHALYLELTRHRPGRS